jgi:hypothetical protein
MDWFVNREKQFKRFLEMLAGTNPMTVMLVEAPAGMGKTWLIQKMRRHCLDNQVPVMHVNFHDDVPYDYLTLVRLAREQMGIQAFAQLTAVIDGLSTVSIVVAASGGGSGTVNINSTTTNVGGDMAGRDIYKNNVFQADSDLQRRAAEIKVNDAFFNCLGELITARGHAVVLFDSFETATAEATRWLRAYLLPRILSKTPSNLLLIVAGEKVPELELEYSDCSRKTNLDLFQEAHIREYLALRHPSPPLDPLDILQRSKGQPSLVAMAVDEVTAGGDAW